VACGGDGDGEPTPAVVTPTEGIFDEGLVAGFSKSKRRSDPATNSQGHHVRNRGCA
jgi:hypothetical protein